MDDDLVYFEEMTYNAKQWADYFLENAVLRDKTDKYAEALRRVQRQILSIISRSIADAIESNDEYNRRTWMERDLKRSFNNPDIIRVDPETGEIDLYIGAEEEAGNWEDFWEGYEAALAEIAPTAFRATAEVRANIWRERIYPDDYLYGKTMAARRRYWGDKAPWWLWLEHGNMGLDGAYPQNTATGFLFLAQDEANDLFKKALIEVENEEYNIVEQAYLQFLDNPDKYSVHDVLAKFYVGSTEYKIYVTPTRRLGVTQRIR